MIRHRPSWPWACVCIKSTSISSPDREAELYKRHSFRSRTYSAGLSTACIPKTYCLVTMAIFCVKLLEFYVTNINRVNFSATKKTCQFQARPYDKTIERLQKTQLQSINLYCSATVVACIELSAYLLWQIVGILRNKNQSISSEICQRGARTLF